MKRKTHNAPYVPVVQSDTDLQYFFSGKDINNGRDKIQSSFCYQKTNLNNNDDNKLNENDGFTGFTYENENMLLSTTTTTIDSTTRDTTTNNNERSWWNRAQ